MTEVRLCNANPASSFARWYQLRI